MQMSLEVLALSEDVRIGKFDSLKETYWKQYFEKDSEFYDCIRSVFAEYLRGGVGVSVGAGPGCEAVLLDQAGIETCLIGVEPSKLHFEGMALASELIRGDSLVKYIPYNSTVSEFFNYAFGIDYLLAIRCLHELEESERQALQKLLYFVKPKGKVIVADVCYSLKQPDPDTVAAVKKVQASTIGHTHEPEDYFSVEEAVEFFRPLKCLSQKRIEHAATLRLLNEAGLGLTKSPMEFYVLVFEN